MSAQDDELVRRYREASAQDEARPGAHVRDAVRAHARMLAEGSASAAVVAAPAGTPPPPAANQPRWKISALATLAVVGLAGLLMLQFDRGTPEERETAFGHRRSETAAPAARPAPPTVPAPAEIPAPPPATAPAPLPAAAPPPAALGNLQGGARDAAAPGPDSAARKPAPSDAAGQTGSLAKSSPSPTPPAEAPAALDNESSRRPEPAGAPSGFPASPPATADRSSPPRMAPPAPSATAAAPRAEQRERPDLQEAPAAAAAAAAAARPAPVPATRNQPALGAAGGNTDGAPSASTAPHAALSNAMSAAARAGDTPRVESLLRQGMPIDARDSAGRTALMLAATDGQAATVLRLLALGANRSLVDHEGLTAAQQARRHGHPQVADLIEARR